MRERGLSPAFSRSVALGGDRDACTRGRPCFCPCWSHGKLGAEVMSKGAAAANSQQERSELCTPGVGRPRSPGGGRVRGNRTISFRRTEDTMAAAPCKRTPR